MTHWHSLPRWQLVEVHNDLQQEGRERNHGSRCKCGINHGWLLFHVWPWGCWLIKPLTQILGTSPLVLARFPILSVCTWVLIDGPDILEGNMCRRDNLAEKLLGSQLLRNHVFHFSGLRIEYWILFGLLLRETYVLTGNFQYCYA